MTLAWFRLKRPVSARPKGVASAKRAKRSSPASEDLFDEEFQKKLEYLAVVSRRVFPGRTRAERRSKKTGSGIEFADYRHYSPGDDYRHLDFNVYRRLGRLLTRLFEEEEDLTVYLLLDVSGSMDFGRPAKLAYAKKLAAAIAYVGLGHLDRVSVLAFRENIFSRLAPTRGKYHIFKIFEFLRPITAKGRTDLASAMRTFVAQNKRRGVAVLISDLYDPAGFETGINTLRYAKFEPYLLHLVDPEDIRPDLHGDALLIDVETGENREVTVTPRLLERYADAHAAYCRRVEEFCTQSQVPVFALNTGIAFEDAVLRILRYGGMVR